MLRVDDAAIARTVALDCLAPRLATPSAMSGFTKSIVLLSASSTVVAYFGSISLATVGEASGLSVLAERPLAAIQTAVGLALCAAMLAILALRGFGRLWGHQEVHLLGDAVEILRHTPVRIRRESVPLSGYLGIAHQVRASLSGFTHEIVLVHPNSNYSVTLLAAERVTQAMLDECKSLLKMPEVSR